MPNRVAILSFQSSQADPSTVDWLSNFRIANSKIIHQALAWKLEKFNFWAQKKLYLLATQKLIDGLTS